MTIAIQALIAGILLGGTYAVLAAGLSLIFGIMRLINFAQAAFMMLAMYATFQLWRLGIDPLFGMFLIAPTAFVVGMLVHRLLLRHVTGSRLNADAQLILTLGLAIAIEYGAQLLFTSTPRIVRTDYSGASWVLGEVLINQARLITFVVAVAVALALYVIITRTPLGTAFRATADDWEESVYVGINSRRMEALAFGLGIAVTAVAGSLLAVLKPVDPFIGREFLIIMFVAVVLGGLGNILGGIVGGFMVGIIETFALFYLPSELAPVIVFALFIGLLVLRPSGILGARMRAV